jgi:hypothetical protein
LRLEIEPLEHGGFDLTLCVIEVELDVGQAQHSAADSILGQRKRGSISAFG